MNKTKLKAYAPVARREFIRAISDRARVLGLSKDGIEPVELKGDVAIIAGQAFPREIGEQREKLAKRIQAEGFDQVVEEIAYTWFNRFVALRYMELHGYLDHGYRVLSNPDGPDAIPEILEKAATLAGSEDIDLPGLDKDKVIELRLAGDKDAELYRMLIVAQCNYLHKVMPFLFEPIKDETELLLPDNLLQTNSPIRKLVNEIDEQDWQEVEIIGWLYQFYISEKKSQVIGKVVKSENIPAATQLFTPNWIVKYMVQNTLGRQWLATYPHSTLREKMEYYIEPADQSKDVQAQLAEITPGELNPEEIKFMDPACGSGHILVEAYDLFKVIYLERGYRTRDIPRLILEKNLYGLDIDDRAVQLAGFALLMKARKDDRRILNPDRPVRLNIYAFQNSNPSSIEEIARVLTRTKVVRLAPARSVQKSLIPRPRQKKLEYKDKPEISSDVIVDLLRLFEKGKTFGSLITIPEEIANNLDAIEKLADSRMKDDLMGHHAGMSVKTFVQLARMLAQKYDHVVANPPYMGSKGMNKDIKEFARRYRNDTKSDLFAMFIDRGFEMTRENGYMAMVTMQSWMFLSSFEKFRERILKEKTIVTMAHLGARAFEEITGEVVQTTAFVSLNKYISGYKPTFFRLVNGSAEDKKNSLLIKESKYSSVVQDDFKKIPGSPIAYWVSDRVRRCFVLGVKLEEFAEPRLGMATGNNDLYVRNWQEVSFKKIGLNCNSREDAKVSRKKWFPYNKGGDFRRWYGNNDYVVNWENDGYLLQNTLHPSGKRIWAHNFNLDYIFKPSVTWTFVSSSCFAVRQSPSGFLFDVGGSSAFPSANYLNFITCFLGSKIAFFLLKVLNPTLNFQAGNIGKLPIVVIEDVSPFDHIAETLILIAKQDWDSFEKSWDFKSLPILTPPLKSTTLEASYNNWIAQNKANIKKMQELEEENNRLFIEAYGLEDELTPDVPEEEITLTVNPKYRYGGNLSEEELAKKFREDTIKELISYAIGCMMGRYSLDEPGLIYAHTGNVDFDPSRYKTFPADEDGIVPVMDQNWFDDDATNRFVEFLKVAWSEDTLEENLKFVADSLGPKQNESPIDTIRRYISTKFFKDHLKMYKKRPIYWLFSSGKHKAFECLVYLHRYNEATLSRMRSAYVTPLQGKLNARIEYLKGEVEAAQTTSARRKLEKELEKLKRKQHELKEFDELLRHFADQRIKLDLDDGVKVNYGKFGKLLAEVKAVTGRG
jgi:type II restriction/modification system DNA methylase subunit YeeA